MYIAIPTRETVVDDHFGHCEYFTVYNVDNNNQIVSHEIVPSLQGCGCKSNIASVLADKGVTLMLAGNIGQGAINVLANRGIQVVRGCSGNTQKVVEDYLSGSLLDSGKTCSSHEGCNH
ncbi:MAG: dinitrogenase iron-molybdenum cofactor biosynthesis protein [Bacteroidetes bacterium GWF2_33_38]|nr:MAG: dinitrogenase iron-molybdenum cofactor biosynthesis protein [Bacteroidetes bacterium GWF2_33_38]OFY68508.1 MAG: dinitrogenase iron-molybdenum cofactor biosynthesis protein [Bacteroidetes bacterium RIFOXYA12_FULL_33_9]OFY91613.1 MAG: dinitrogenase iron-molybdenum cofactor biosynthesis protein [Bacteroidetes bacterium RIFOXYA2_FULL_33_7]HBX52581.1 dinitrogenase iron-molybdenum cofactor biosynthesis protein [Bacteroidales bacterium]